MEMQTITEDPHVARRAFLDYRKELRRPLRQAATDAERELREVDEELMRAYRELAKGTTLLRLSETIAAGGYRLAEYVNWRERTASLLPKLAAVRADARIVVTGGVWGNGSIEFQTRMELHQNNRRDRVFLAGAFGEPEAFADPVKWQKEHPALPTPRAGTRVGRWETEAWQAIVPTIPPQFRPAHALEGYHLLFEVDAWQRTPAPPKPADPALLKHIGGDLYAVLATWDLTPLEAAVLGQRR